MKRNKFKYLLFGVLFVGIQEFWVSVIWRGDFVGFVLAVLITETVFFTFTYLCGLLFERQLKGSRLIEPILFVVFGVTGLVVIEWWFVGNTPSSEASQIVMFSTWGGSAIMARIFTDQDARLNRLRKLILMTFVPVAALATLLGLTLPTHEMRFTVTYLTANFGYLALNVFYLMFFIQKFRTSKIDKL